MHKQGALREFGHYAAMNILGMIGISCYILADTYFVAQGLGSLGLAALNIAIPAYNLMNGIGLMLGVGAATQYTIARAQNDRRQADSVFTHTAALGLLLGLLFLLGGLCFAKPLAGLLGADAQTLGMTTTYLRMLWCFGPFFVMNNVLLAFTRNDGAPTVAMCGMIAGSLFNIVFDYIFIFPCGLGMFGAALATGFSPFVSILVLLTHLRRPSRGFHLVKTPLCVSRVPSLCAPGLSSLIGEIASGVVLLLFDVTQKQKAEALRREFTANVSHELKTPLHAISGYAELMKDGLVPPEDTRHFAEKIYSEAQRMIDLVEDTLRLSRLDEGAADMQWAPIDLYETAKSAMQELTAPAELKNVSIQLEGKKTVIQGIPQLVSGIVFNLMDNAVKYNKDGGLVIVRLGEEKGQAVLTVTDTGIGISPEHQERVFERFYRVDKSHSKEIGGTGLGLSIVKHAALILGATIELDSTVGKGTIVTVRFPIEKK